MEESKDVRLQVPVSEDLASELAYLAERMERSVAWLTCEMLKQTLESREDLADRLGLYLFGLISDAKTLLTGKKRRSPEKQGEVRLQIAVPAAVADEIETLAARLNVSAVRMAGLLLQTGVREHGIIIEAITTKPVKAILKGVGIKRSPDPDDKSKRKAAPA